MANQQLPIVLKVTYSASRIINAKITLQKIKPMNLGSSKSFQQQFLQTHSRMGLQRTPAIVKASSTTHTETLALIQNHATAAWQ